MAKSRGSGASNVVHANFGRAAGLPCPACRARLPDFKDTIIDVVALVQLVGVTFHVVCRCGQPLDLKMGIVPT
jgi:hypothetical protein